MEGTKKAFVFDTNFIIQNPNLDETLEKIKDEYIMYITQISIDERIAQQCRELKKNFDEAAKLSSKFAFFAKIEFTKTYEEATIFRQKGMQAKYEQYFENHVIPFDKTGEMLEAVLIRANQKLPPFSSAKDASDKGFKDCLLWLSLLDYFKDSGEDEIIFLTDDNAFINNSEYLCNEFKSMTKKTIEIKSNSSFKELIPQEESVIIETPNPIPLLDFTSLRDEIQQTIENLRWAPYEDQYGDIEWNKTYNTNVTVDSKYMEVVFKELENTIIKYILNKTLPASRVLGLDDRIIDFDEIPMSSIEECLKLYKKIISQYPKYIQQFYEASAAIINQNYIAPNVESDDDFPF